jgi:hypothetical protein
MKIKYSDKLRVNSLYTYKPFGLFKETQREGNEADIEVLDSIPEYTFYFLYLSINNVVAKETLTDTQLMVMSAIMEKPLEFSLPVDSKDRKLSDLAVELSPAKGKKRSANSIYQTTKRLRDKGYLIINEDKLIVPNKTLQNLRKMVKGKLATDGHATFDYIFKCVIHGQNA